MQRNWRGSPISLGWRRDFDRLGSTVVDLGNNFATTEAEIVAMALRLAGAGDLIGLTEAQILGICHALTSVGVNAEAGGTAFSRIFTDIDKAVAKPAAKNWTRSGKWLERTAGEFAGMFKLKPGSSHSGIRWRHATDD